MIRRTHHKTEAGLFLIESLVVVLLFGVLGLILAHSNILSSKIRNRSSTNALAMQLATERMEALGAIDPATLDASDNVTDSVSREGKTFTRQVQITVNADASRSIAVSIRNTVSSLGGTASLANRFALWGSQ